jgi:hypothetical protein
VPRRGGPSGGLARPSQRPIGRTRAAHARPRRGAVSSCRVEGKGSRAVGGCTKQDEKWCSSPRRSGVGDVARRGRRGGILTAEDGSQG